MVRFSETDTEVPADLACPHFLQSLSPVLADCLAFLRATWTRMERLAAVVVV